MSQVTEGLGTGSLNVAVLDPSKIEDGAVYKVSFNSSGDIPNYKTSSYSISRTINGVVDTVESNIGTADFGAGKYSTPFDGIAVSISNYDSVSVDLNKTGWLKGFSTLYMPVKADDNFPQSDVAWPSDYEIEWVDSTIITPFNKIPINFKVTNITRGEQVQAEVLDNNKDKVFNLGDEILIIEYVGTTFKITWNVGYYPPLSIPYIVHPSPGDKFLVKINKPFKSGDYFSFSTTSSKVNTEYAKDELGKIGVVPNPYISANAWERRNLNQTGRGERRIDFINLPAQCDIRIYTLTGALIKTIYKDSSPTNGSVSWNLITDDGMDIAYGVYIYHVSAPGIGDHIGKFAVIK